MGEDRISRAVDAAIASAAFDIDAEPIDGVDARVRFVDQAAVSSLSALYKDPRSRGRVVELLQERLGRGVLSAQQAASEDPGWRQAFVAMRLQERLAAIDDRRYIETAQGRLELVAERELKEPGP